MATCLHLLMMLVSQSRAALLVACLWSLNTPWSAAVEGGVQVYLQPLAAETARLTFSLDSLSAVSSTGAEYPLSLQLKTAGGAETRRQRLLATGRLPTGRYVGFLVRVGRAALKGERGDIALLVPDAGVRLDAPFSVAPAQTPLFWFSLKYQESLREDAQFSPVFSAVMPAKPVAGRAGFVSNFGSDTITVFDKGLGQAVAVIDTCMGPAGLALDQRRRRLYVACQKGDEIQAIDVVTGEIAQRTQTSPGDQPRELALTPDGGTLLAVNPGSSSVTFLDALSLARQDRLNVGSGPNSAVLGPDGQRAFVCNTQSGTISVIDIAHRRVSATLSVDGAPLRGRFGNSGARLYVIDERTPYLLVIDPAQLNVVTRARLNGSASAIVVDPVRGLISVASDGSASVEFYDPNALVPLFLMKSRAGTSFLAADPEDNRLYLVNPRTRSLVIGSLADRTMTSEIDVGSSPYWVAIMGER
jgi:YVTN family beta-propeller protein